MKSKPDKHIFVCTNIREGKRKSCGKTGIEIREDIKKRLIDEEEKLNIRINKSGCLGFCESGPCMVIYPQKTWYANIKLSDCKKIFKQSIIENSIIDELDISKIKSNK